MVSAGNVAQLAVDLLISTLKLEQIGVFDSRDLIPVAGGREDGPGISTPLECKYMIICYVLYSELDQLTN